MSETMTCERCGTVYGVGQSAWCRDQHGYVNNVKQPPVTYPGGLTLHNLGPTPVTVYSESERQAIMKARGLREAVYHIPTPGSDTSIHTTTWSSVDLAGAAALVNRVADAHASKLDGSLETLEVDWLRTPRNGPGVRV